MKRQNTTAIVGTALCVLLAGCSGAVSRPSVPSGTAAPLVLQLPISGIHGTQWTIWQYVDHDPSSGLRDYTGGDRTYDGHDGTDFGVPSFRSMDNDLVAVLAAAAGRVTFVRDGQFDRMIADSVEAIISTPICTQGGRSNNVVIEHPNGYETRYGHLKKGVSVRVGDRVAAGDKLGIVGSSGCSTGPHLHFEVVDRSGNEIDPFATDLWSNPPSYETPFGLLEYYIFPGDHDGSIGQDPPPNIESLGSGDSAFFAIHVAGIRKDDVIRLEAVSGTLSHEFTTKAQTDSAGSIWTWRTPELTASGEWIFNALVNDNELQIKHTVTVE